MSVRLQNDGYSLSVSSTLDTSTGICDKDAYRDYLEQMYDDVYHIWGDPVSVNIGLSPSSMENGLSDFLTRNSNSKTNITWAKNSIVGINTQKQYVLETIDEDEDIPSTNSHYMTVVGLYKYADKKPMDNKYVLEVVSWGAIYYIDYDEYADNLSYFSNILSVY